MMKRERGKRGMGVFVVTISSGEFGEDCEDCGENQRE